MNRCQTRWNHQTLIVGVGHDQAANKARGNPPRSCIGVLLLPLLVLKLHIESLREVLPQIVAGACLKCFFVLHHGFDAECVLRARELLPIALGATQHRHGHPLFSERAVHLEHTLGFFFAFLFAGVGRVAFLPEEFGGAQK